MIHFDSYCSDGLVQPPASWMSMAWSVLPYFLEKKSTFTGWQPPPNDGGRPLQSFWVSNLGNGTERMGNGGSQRALQRSWFRMPFERYCWLIASENSAGFSGHIKRMALKLMGWLFCTSGVSWTRGMGKFTGSWQTSNDGTGTTLFELYIFWWRIRNQKTTNERGGKCQFQWV